MKITYKERYTQLINSLGTVLCEKKGMRSFKEMIDYYYNEVVSIAA